MIIISAQAYTLSILAGSSNRLHGGIEIQVTRIYQNPSFDVNNLIYDVSVLILSNILEFGPTMQPIALVDQEPEAGSLSIVTGWGTTFSGGDLTDDLLKVELHVTDRKLCEDQYDSGIIHESMICAADENKDSCQVSFWVYVFFFAGSCLFINWLNFF